MTTPRHLLGPCRHSVQITGKFDQPSGWPQNQQIYVEINLRKGCRDENITPANFVSWLFQTLLLELKFVMIFIYKVH